MAEEAVVVLHGGGGDIGGGGGMQHFLHRCLLRAHIREEGRWSGGGGDGVGRWVAQAWCVLRRPRTGQPRAADAGERCRRGGVAGLGARWHWPGVADGGGSVSRLREGGNGESRVGNQSRGGLVASRIFA